MVESGLVEITPRIPQALKNCALPADLLSPCPPKVDGFQQATSMVYRVLTRPCDCLLYTSPSPRDRTRSRMPSSA